MSTATSHYRLPAALVLAVGWDALRSRRRYLSHDVAPLWERLGPPAIQGQEHIPRTSRFVLLMNHCHPPEVPVWWYAMLASHLVASVRPGPRGQVTWVLSAAWTYPDPVRQRLLTPLTRWAFRRLARTYGFISMPPMPPDPRDLPGRAAALREIMRRVRSDPDLVLGFAPEGRDHAEGPRMELVDPPPGVFGGGQFLVEQHVNIRTRLEMLT